VTRQFRPCSASARFSVESLQDQLGALLKALLGGLDPHEMGARLGMATKHVFVRAAQPARRRETSETDETNETAAARDRALLTSGRRSRLTAEQANRIRGLFLARHSIPWIAKNTGVSRATIYRLTKDCRDQDGRAYDYNDDPGLSRALREKRDARTAVEQPEPGNNANTATSTAGGETLQ